MNKKNEVIEILKKEEIEVINNNVLKAMKSNKFEKIYSTLPGLSKYFNVVKTGVNDDNLKEMLELRANINKFKKHVETLRKEWYKEKTENIDKYVNGFKEFEVLLDFKAKEITKHQDLNDKKNIIVRYQKFKDYYNEVIEGYEAFDFINFEEHFKTPKMENKGSFNDKGEIKKAGKDYIIEKIEQFADDYLALMNDEIAINYYKQNDFNVAKAMAFSKQQRELLNKENEVKEAQQEEQKQEITSKPKVTKVEKVIKNNDEDNFKKILVTIDNANYEKFVKMLNANKIKHEILGE